MAKPKPKDNSSRADKIALRKRALVDLAAMGVSRPVVMETHGGNGVLFDKCYEHLPVGIVFEKDGAKAERLARQRPTWRVYEADCENALRHGVAADLAFDLLDCDPYGGCWLALSAFFGSQRAFADRMLVAVNDGMRQALSMGAAWSIKALESFVLKYGNDALYQHYGDICGEFIHEKAAAVSYSVSRFVFYYCGKKNFVTHWYALLTRSAA